MTNGTPRPTRDHKRHEVDGSPLVLSAELRALLSKYADCPGIRRDLEGLLRDQVEREGGPS